MTPTSSQQPLDCLDGLGEFVRAMMADWNVPGLSVAVIKDGQTVFAEGFGYRDVAAKLPVTQATLFPICSCTKAFTCAALAILVDEGKLDWDLPVRKYLPELRLADQVVAERITARDLVTHRSGLPRHDLFWYSGVRSRADLLASLEHLEFSKDFRTTYQYNNLMYMVAGCLIERITGIAWEDFVRARLLDPLGMAAAVTSLAAARATADHARPYVEKPEQAPEGVAWAPSSEELGEPVIAVPYFEFMDGINPAGGILAGAAEMANWVALNLAKGKRGETRIVSEAQIEQMQLPHMATPAPQKYPELPPLGGYGLGWALYSYRGYRVVSHGGAIDGFSTLVALLPEANAGLVVLSNLGGSPTPTLIAYEVFDLFLGLKAKSSADVPVVDWSARFRAERLEAKDTSEKRRLTQRADRVVGTSPSHPLASYIGDYSHPAYGRVAIRLAEDGTDASGLKITLNSLEGRLEHYHFDIFENVRITGDRVRVSFLTGPKGTIDSLASPLEQGVSDIIFRRVAE